MSNENNAAKTINFSNEGVNVNTIPSMTQLTYQAISTNYARANRTINLIASLMVMFATVLISYQTLVDLTADTRELWLKLTWPIGMIGLFITMYRAKADTAKFYSLREQDISYCSGLLFKKIISQPIKRVQHVELKRGPIDRRIGLARLQVFSAGGALHTFEIPGLPLAEAETLRHFILSHKDSTHHG